LQLFDFESKYASDVAEMINTARWKERLFTNPQYHVTPDSLVEYIKDKKKNCKQYWMLIAIEKGKVIGYIDFEITNNNEGLLRGIYLKHNYRNKGIGRKMIAEAERLLKNNGCNVIYAYIFEDNADAIRFLERQGYLYQKAEKHSSRNKKYIVMKKEIIY